MKKIFPIVLLFLVSLCFVSYGQKQKPVSLGIGFTIVANPYLYEDGLSYPKDIFRDENLKEKIKTDKIFPFFYKPDYGLFHFICLEKTKRYYKILLNDTDIAFVPNNENYIFKAWETLLLGSSVARIDKQKNPIRENPTDNDQHIIISDCKSDYLKVIDVIEQKGVYWIEVYFASNCEPYPNKKEMDKHGWIKWRENNRLLIEMMLLC